MTKTIFISGIDTEVGKTMVTGVIARDCIKNNINAITQKLTQTGVVGLAEDIITHRKIMGIELSEFDIKGTTCPYVFKTPASPHLAAELENTEINHEKIKQATNELEKKFDLVLLEGAGGLHVPINNKVNIIDYIQENNYPLILVASSKLGSINHTLLSLELLKNRGIKLLGLVYNEYPNDNADIQKDSIKVFERYMSEWFPDIPVIKFPFKSDSEDFELSNDNLIKQIMLHFKK